MPKWMFFVSYRWWNSAYVTVSTISLNMYCLNIILCIWLDQFGVVYCELQLISCMEKNEKNDCNTGTYNNLLTYWPWRQNAEMEFFTPHRPYSPDIAPSGGIRKFEPIGWYHGRIVRQLKIFAFHIRYFCICGIFSSAYCVYSALVGSIYVQGNRAILFNQLMSLIE